MIKDVKLAELNASARAGDSSRGAERELEAPAL
jgi:hypothetical protein